MEHAERTACVGECILSRIFVLAPRIQLSLTLFCPPTNTAALDMTPHPAALMDGKLQLTVLCVHAPRDPLGLTKLTRRTLPTP